MPEYVFGVYPTAAAPPPATLQATTSTLPSGILNATYPALALTATGGTAPYTWSLVAPNNTLPSGMSLVNGVLSGVPTANGTFALNFRVTDAVAATADTGLLTLVITAVSGLTVTTTTLPTAVRGEPYTASLQAVNGVGAVTWSMVSPHNVLPTGLTLVGSTITGTPTVAGPVGVVFRATDSTAATADSGVLTLTVAQVPALSIITTSVPPGEVALNATRMFQTSGGWGDVDWVKTAGDFPVGMSFDGETGVLSGTPTTADTYSFTLQATDAEARTASRVFSMNIVAAGTGEGPHTYFETQIARPEVLAGENVGYFSLRSNTSLIASGVDWPTTVWSYVYGTAAENKPDGIDAAKIIMPHSLSTNDQAMFQFKHLNIDDGTFLTIVEWMHAQECVTNVLPNSGLTHKWLQFEGGPRTNGSGGLWIEPRVLYTPDAVTNHVGPKNLRTYFTDPFLTNFGLLTGTPYNPTGLGAVALDAVDQRPNVLCREWFEIAPSLPGTAFTEWNSTYCPSTPGVGTSPIYDAVVDGTDTVLTVDSGYLLSKVDEPPRNSWCDAHTGGSADGNGCRVTIAGTSNPALNGVHDVIADDFTHLRVVGLAAAGTGGTVSQHFAMFSWWHAEEDIEPVRLIYRVPVRRVGPGKVTDMRFELNTSKGIETLRGFFITAPPTQTSNTVIEIGPHDIQTNETVWMYQCPSIPTGAYVATRVSDTAISVPYTVTSEATIYPSAQNPIDRVDLGDIGEGDTFTIKFRDNVTTVITFATDMTAAIQSAMRAMPQQSASVVTKVSDQVYDIEFRTTRTTLLQVRDSTGLVAPTDFTPGTVVRIQPGISNSYLSGTYGRVVKPLVMYARNLVFLRNFTVDENDTTLFKRPVR